MQNLIYLLSQKSVRMYYAPENYTFILNDVTHIYPAKL